MHECQRGGGIRVTGMCEHECICVSVCVGEQGGEWLPCCKVILYGRGLRVPLLVESVSMSVSVQEGECYHVLR